jgi:hypothetical protein
MHRNDLRRRWILTDYDSTGLMQIQANDAHPKRFAAGAWFNDDQALALAQRQAKRGDVAAAMAVTAHNRDAGAVEAYRAANEALNRAAANGEA